MRRTGPPAFVAICQSGFPEAEHSAVAIEICHNFASSAGLEWAGGLVMPEGGMLNGQPMSKMKHMMRSAVAALDLTAEALAAGRPVPDEAVRADGEAGVPSPRLPVHGQLGLALAGQESGRRDADGRAAVRVTAGAGRLAGRRAGGRSRPGIAPPPLPKRSRIVSSSGRKRCTWPLRIAQSHIGSSFFQPLV